MQEPDKAEQQPGTEGTARQKPLKVHPLAMPLAGPATDTGQAVSLEGGDEQGHGKVNGRTRGIPGAGVDDG